MVFTANHLSHFMLTNLLLPDLEKTKSVISCVLYCCLVVVVVIVVIIVNR